MVPSYTDVSKEVGYVGYMPYPAMEDMDDLLHNLSSNPTISQFVKALSLYRFVPEAKTRDEEKMVYMLQLGLSTAKSKLFIKEERPRFAEVAVNYILNLIPTLTIILLVG